eukprot:6197221-Pleurochrysis_carterae.AAC.1
MRTVCVRASRCALEDLCGFGKRARQDRLGQRQGANNNTCAAISEYQQSKVFVPPFPKKAIRRIFVILRV